MDSQGYPDDEELARIEKWPLEDIAGLFKFVHSLWWMPNWGWKQEGRKFRISTGGWSGNESLISAMEENAMIFSLTCKSWRVGGHYEFQLPEWAVSQMPQE